jgi:hypothetical protein
MSLASFHVPLISGQIIRIERRLAKPPVHDNKWRNPWLLFSPKFDHMSSILDILCSLLYNWPDMIQMEKEMGQ